MYTILIVDDEKEEQEGVSFLLDEFGYSLQKAFASNGRLALAYLEENHVDILFTDVRMPVMDGLALAEEARRLFPKLKIIIFSGFSDFEYARKAIRIKVTSYILKPVNIEEFQKTLDWVIEELNRDNAEKEKLFRQESYARKHLLFSLISHADTDESLISEAFAFAGKYERMILLEFENEFFDKAGIDFEQEILSKINLPAEYLNLDMCQSILLFPKHEIEISYCELAQNLYEWLQISLDKKCYLAVSKNILPEESLSPIFRNLEQMMEYRFFIPNTPIFDSEGLEEKLHREEPESDRILEQIQQNLKAKNYLQLKLNIDLLCQKYERNSAFSQLYVKFIFSSLYRDLVSEVSQEDASEQHLNQAIDQMYRSNDIQEITSWIRVIADKLESPPHPQKASMEVDLVKDYINTHYGEDLDLSSLADKVYLSPQYLSTLFKRVTGLGINRYIKSVRMEKAKDLLEHTNLKIVDLCEAVGFRNLSYFCQNFRDYYGETPEKYRNTDYYQNKI